MNKKQSATVNDGNYYSLFPQTPEYNKVIHKNQNNKVGLTV